MSIKSSYNTNRIILGEKLPLVTPLSIIIDVSEKCNFRCNYCFRSKKKDASWGFAAAEESMGLDLFKRVAEQLTAFPEKISLVSLSGHGEPLCNRYVPEMVSYLRELDVASQIDMHTNASLLREDIISDIAQAGFTRIVISLQGLNAAAYERVCGAKINFQRFYDNLKRLYEQKGRTHKIHIKIVDAALTPEDPEENEERFYALFGPIADHVFVERMVPIWDAIDASGDMENKFGNTFGEVNYCPLLFYKIMVAPDGEVYPCTHLPPPFSLGNVQNITLQQVWSSPTRQTFLIEHLRKMRHGQMPCVKCFVATNSVMSQEDILDEYKDAILERLESFEKDG